MLSNPNSSQLKARIWAVTLIAALGLWTLHGFLAPLAWAVVIGITTWPLVERARERLPERQHPATCPAILTLLVAIILFGPMTYGIMQLVQELQSVALLLQEAQRNGLPAPDWLNHIPMVGDNLVATWGDWLGNSDSVRESSRHILGADLLKYSRMFASQIFHRYAVAFFIVVVLFFVYLYGRETGQRVLALCDRTFGPNGRHYALHATTAIRATVNGIVLVAMGQGLALGFGYALAGLQHAMLLGVLTGVVALIPFAAKVVCLGAALVLFAGGQTGAAIGLTLYGLAVILTSDNYLRPKLIGNAVKLPFIWTLLGILGGIESFGLIGLFLGPTLMAVLVSVWRDLFEEGQAVVDSSE